MDLKLTDKAVLVTGSTAGIGFAIARSLASEGAHVYLNGRTHERVNAAMAAIRSHAAAGKVDGIVADFSSSAGAEGRSSRCDARRTRPPQLRSINHSHLRPANRRVTGRQIRINPSCIPSFFDFLPVLGLLAGG